MRIVSLNINGIRAGARKGFFDWMLECDADIVCLQEIKAQRDQIQAPCFHPPGYHAYFYPAEKKGYSGVAIYSRYRPNHVQYGLDWPSADSEGRFVKLRFDSLSVSSLYLPSGTSGDARQQVKYDLMKHYAQCLKQQTEQGEKQIICGDWNIAHKIIDIKNWRANQQHSGFLPEERAWMDTLFSTMGYADAFRIIDQTADQYTWWSNRGQAWAKNVGWRIDYQVISSTLQSAVTQASIYKHHRFSDHAPLIIDYAISL